MDASLLQHFNLLATNLSRSKKAEPLLLMGSYSKSVGNSLSKPHKQHLKKFDNVSSQPKFDIAATCDLFSWLTRSALTSLSRLSVFDLAALVDLFGLG